MRYGPGPQLITKSAVGAWESEVLFTLAELDIVTVLAAESLTAPVLADRLGTHADATSALLDAGVALRLL
ncbi:hypothetical protein LP52_05035 [Streptomonospora alba]|uniref:O-methyltransferase dimerisation domain-containing protein n=1 Tax=Streptomonospora alba TaxID=183763 RepID=A0A0C2JE89_9ACTN|nr:methyltransferase dimerization domain-containing protein [Streptomonospora alba]KIH99636.1 hypothetical protein LP52_05035 [Streptomonospora alba]